MKKIIIVLTLILMSVNVCFSITLAEKLLLPEFTGDLSTIPFKVIEETNDSTIVEINGIVYIIKHN